MRPRSLPAAVASSVIVVGLLLAACSVPAGAGSQAPSPSPEPASPAMPSPLPVPSGVSEADAVAIVLALDPLFTGINARNAASFGQGSWYEVTADPAGWDVTVQVGWGDCLAGCINRHTWEYRVGLDGAVTKVREAGDGLPAASGPTPSKPRPTPRPVPRITPSPTGEGSSPPPLPIPSSGGPWLVGVATAGPVCPVEHQPPDPACAPRPVVGAKIAVLDPSGRVLATATTGSDGTYRVSVPAGRVRVQAAPDAGLMGTPGPIDVVVPSGPGAWVRVDLEYDTGIR